MWRSSSSDLALQGLCERTMGSSFALRRLLAGSDSGFCGADGFRGLPTLEQLRGRKAAAPLPYGSSFRGQPNLSPRGTRAIHGSRAVSESAGGFANRLLSPHIALKKPQMAATYSITYRNFGAAASPARKYESSRKDIISYMRDLDGEQKELIKKFVNFRMSHGKRTRVSPILYKTFHRLVRNEGDGINLLGQAVDHVKPICEVVKVRVAGTLYDVPGLLGRDRQQSLAIRWILGAALKRRQSSRVSFEKSLFAEIVDAYRKRGGARQKRENLHGLASTNRSFAHFRWW